MRLIDADALLHKLGETGKEFINSPDSVEKVLSLSMIEFAIKIIESFATNLIDRGMPIQEVAAILGHDKIDTTMTYVYISKQNVRNSYRKYS